MQSLGMTFVYLGVDAIIHIAGPVYHLGTTSDEIYNVCGASPKQNIADRSPRLSSVALGSYSMVWPRGQSNVSC